MLAAPIGIGIAITAMQITRTDDTNTRTDDLYTTNTPRQPSPTEAAAGFTSGSPSLSPASTATPSQSFIVSGYPSQVGTSTVDVCNKVATLYGSPYTGTIHLVSTVSYCKIANGATVIADNPISVLNTCPTGYSLSGQACALSNASAVPRPVDNACPIVRSGNSYANDATDPDCANGQAPHVIVDATGQTISINDASGSSFSLHVNGDGTSSITTTVPDTATNTTKKRVIDIAAPASPAEPPLVTGVSDSVLSGTGTGASTAALTQTTVVPDAVQTAALQDIAAQEAATAQDRAAADTAATALPSALPAAPWNVSSLGLPAQSQFSYSAPAVPLPSGGACAPLSMPLLGSTASVDVCPFVTTFTPIFNWLIVMMGVSSGMWQVFSRNRQEA